MSGQHITQRQENIYMKHRQTGSTQELSSAKAGVSIRSGRRIEKGERSDKTIRHWKTRKDPLEAVWESELVPLLANEPELTGISLWDHLDDQYPGQYPETLLRTLQRRIAGPAAAPRARRRRPKCAHDRHPAMAFSRQQSLERVGENGGNRTNIVTHARSRPYW